MDKQMIEKLKKDIAVRMAMAKGIVGSMNNGVEGWLAEYLIEKGWAKINEGAVVFTREEYDDMFTFKTVGSAEKHCGFYNILDTVRKVERKETAEKFAERLKQVGELHYYFGEQRYDIATDDIDEICKELTEGEKEISNETV